MVERISKILSERLFAHCRGLKPERLEVVAYGMEVVLSVSSTVLFMLLISAALHTIRYTIMFILGFVLMRVFCNGYHAKTFAGCFLSTNLLHAMTIMGGICGENCKGCLFLLLLAAMAAGFIIYMAPVHPEKHNLAKNACQRFKKYTMVLASILLLGLKIAFQKNMYGIVVSGSIALLETAIFMVL